MDGLRKAYRAGMDTDTPALSAHGQANRQLIELLRAALEASAETTASAELDDPPPVDTGEGDPEAALIPAR